jgi:hypothetical protein
MEIRDIYSNKINYNSSSMISLREMSLTSRIVTLTLHSLNMITICWIKNICAASLYYND